MTVVESEAFHITDLHVDYSPVEAVVRAPIAPARALPKKPARLGLQQRAELNFRRYFLRALWRFVVLVIADLASLYVMRALVRAVRNQAVFGSRIADEVSTWLPAGILNGWQYAAALFVGLLLLGNYGRGDARRNPKRLFLACALATALPLWMTIWTRGLELVAVQYVVTTGLVWLGLVMERRLLNSIVHRVRPRPAAALNTLFISTLPL
ncbi:MAG: hypothetical protein DMD54_17760 [Gemmatimonadetes bacterium]|nr:MAG: hypothetical protein DMD54_17760 [Gemmatimonadota bacterium]